VSYDQDDLQAELEDGAKRLLGLVLRDEDKDLLKYASEISRDMLECALIQNDELYAEHLAQVAMVRGLARGRASDRARKVFGVVIKTVVGIARKALL
jgi:hypothetical protein